MLRETLLLLSVLVIGASQAIADEPRAERSAETRAIAWLVGEVPGWSREHRCFSCHHNGDAFRALAAARGAGLEFDRSPLSETVRWLASPGEWKNNRGDPRFGDKTLATIQFALALSGAIDAGLVDDKQALRTAAGLVAPLQQKDGSWKLDGPETIGGPTTWGRALSTALAQRVLVRAGRERFAREIRAAETWMLNFEVQTVLDAGAVLLGLAETKGQDAAAQRKRCLEIIRRGESRDGGWGPYVTSPPEAFDTSVVLLALAVLGTEAPKDVLPMRQRGRKSLVKSQLEDGSWIETTRPADETSYPQRLSTAGWALEALLSTRDLKP